MLLVSRSEPFSIRSGMLLQFSSSTPCQFVGQKYPRSPEDCKREADHDQKPVEHSFLKANVLATELEIKADRKNDADYEAKERSHKAHDTVKGRTDDRNQRDDYCSEGMNGNLEDALGDRRLPRG